MIYEYIVFKYDHTRFRYCNLGPNDFQIGVGFISFVRQGLFASQFFIDILFSLDPILAYEVSSFTNSCLISSPLSFIYVLCFFHLSHAKIPDLSLSSYPLFRPVKIFSFLDTLAITILSGIIPVSLLFKFAFSFAFFSRPLFSIAAASLFI